VITGIIGMRKGGLPGGTGKGLAIGGLVTGILAMIVTIGLYTFLGAVLNSEAVQDAIREAEQQQQNQ